MTDRPAARLYLGHVMHMRLVPRLHRFRYRVFSLLVDLDRLGEVTSGTRLLGHNHGWILSIHDRDHGARDGSALRPWVEAQLAREGLPPAATIEMLSFPRMFGYGFNPLTVYYCRNEAGALSSLVYEVKNTYGDQTAYAVPAGPGVAGSYRQMHRKEMYVSPFIGMDQTYRFTLGDPEGKLSLRIRQAGPEGETLIATHTARARPVTDTALLHAIIVHPLMTLRVIAAIHWQALRLFLKGVKYRPYESRTMSREEVANG